MPVKNQALHVHNNFDTLQYIEHSSYNVMLLNFALHVYMYAKVKLMYSV